MWHILSFDIGQEDKGYVFSVFFERLFPAFQLGLLEFGLSLMVLNFCIEDSVVKTLSNLRFYLRILENFCKNKPPNIRMIAEAKKK